MHSNANIDLAYDILNYEPKISFEEGIEKYINSIAPNVRD